MSNKTVYLKSLLMAIIMLPMGSYAQYTPLSQQLTDISKEMYRNGNEFYVLVDAVKDGILKPEKKLSFMFINDTMSFNNQKIAGSMHKQYSNKMTQFMEKNNDGHTYFMAIYDVPFSMKDILDEHSAFRTHAGHSKG
jgi:hypothetical protein